MSDFKNKVRVIIAPEFEGSDIAKSLSEKFSGTDDAPMTLSFDSDGLSLISDGKILRGDFTKMINRIKPQTIGSELLAKAAKIKDAGDKIYAVDATAGLGEDSLILAAAGFYVKMYEQNPVIYELLCDAKRRAEDDSFLVNIVSRMEIFNANSIEAMGSLDFCPDIILLDPMFPERQKSALVKNKLQVIQSLEMPCANEVDMLYAATMAKPKRIVIKRPPKGEFLASVKPDYSISGKAVRFDCIAMPYEKKHKMFK